MHVCMYVCMNADTMWICIWNLFYSYIHTFNSIHLYIYTYTSMHTYIHTYITSELAYDDRPGPGVFSDQSVHQLQDQPTQIPNHSTYIHTYHTIMHKN